MDYTLALLFSLLHLLSVATAAPLPVEVVTMKSKVKWRAEQLLVRLNSLHQQDFQVIFMVLFVVTLNLKLLFFLLFLTDWCSRCRSLLI